MTGTVGMELRQARERARLSLQDLSARTKIRATLLDAIEREAFERVPGGLLTRGYLRAYAREVGLDPEAIVRQYIAEFEPDRAAPERPPPQETEWEPQPGGRARWAFLIPAIPLALAAIFFLRVQRPAGPVAADPAAPIGTTGQPVGAVEVEQEALEPPPTVEPPAATPAPPPIAEGLRLEIHPASVLWVEAAADGTPVLHELVEAGERRRIDAETEITMRIGDAAAFAYSINGLPGRTLGGSGEVRDIRITRDNYETFVIRD
ncbi:MAG: DUF4115 domain-containing protein [Acidobacteria bacterium]|nr:DUF4115 domain-containing protein [Acidobacteriota bacterium]